MNYLVTGGCGFIGSNFIHHLFKNHLKETDAVVNLDLLTYAGNKANLDAISEDSRYYFVQGDIRDRGLVEKTLHDFGVGKIIHFAAESHVDRSIEGPYPFFETNTMGTFHLLETVLNYFNRLNEIQKDQFTFLHVSTDEVFGSLGELDPSSKENSPYAPNSPYAASKAASDHIVRSYNKTYGLPTIITHCSNNFGPYQFPEKLIPLMILNALEGKPLPIYGDGRNIRDWLYITDHAEALYKILHSGHIGISYNIGGDAERTNIEVVNNICGILDNIRPRGNGSSYKDQIMFVKDRPGHDRRYSLNCDKLQTALSWKPKESFESGLAKTVEWYIDNLSWCQDIYEKKYKRERLGSI